MTGPSTSTWPWPWPCCRSPAAWCSPASWSAGFERRRAGRAALLALGVAVTWLSCLGVLLMDDPYDRLHYTAPASALAPVLVAAAVVVEEGLSAAGIKALLVAFVL